MTTPKVSIIVPVYNTEQYLKRCLDSIMNQTLQEIEIIIVDDGSKEACALYCDELSKTDARIKVVHKKNGGLGFARNTGISVATGEYIGFVDSDDYIECNHLYNLTYLLDSDFILGGIKLCSSGVAIQYEDKQYLSVDVLDFINQNKGTRINAPWGSLYKRTILIEHRLQFDVNIRFGEDALFNLRYLYYCDSIRTISSCGYYYWDYDISSNASQKYNLSIDEAYYTLSQILDYNKKLGSKYGGLVSPIADHAMILGMISVEKRCNNLELFYSICKELGIISDRKGFYNQEVCSPIFQGIAQLKCLYEVNDYFRVRDIFTLLHPISKNACAINFRCKDFYLWHTLLKIGNFSLFNFFIKNYFRIKKILK